MKMEPNAARVVEIAREIRKAGHTPDRLLVPVGWEADGISEEIAGAFNGITRYMEFAITWVKPGQEILYDEKIEVVIEHGDAIVSISLI